MRQGNKSVLILGSYGAAGAAIATLLGNGSTATLSWQAGRWKKGVNGRNN
ncbi:hypothetical protein Q673_18430 [Marinobacter sp. EN3]|jgi:Na+-driven multidrug efflux pump|nr:hypothetical protein Q673_18430 [Marinobacter sp. EN3]QBM16526.1 hypothetical protein MARI_06080 [Marinobacter sp. JH2]